MDSPEINPHVYDNMIFNKGAKTAQWGKTVSSTNDVGKTRCLYAKEWNWTLTLHYIQKVTQNGLKT